MEVEDDVNGAPEGVGAVMRRASADRSSPVLERSARPGYGGRYRGGSRSAAGGESDMALKLDRMQDTADVKRYARVVARAWMDPEYKARLVADPRPLLGAAGLDIPTEADVRIVDADVTSIDASGGVITFGLPSAPKGGLGDESLNWKVASQGSRGSC